MSRPEGAFAFAQPRLQARLGERPTPGQWQRLRATDDAGLLLQLTASTPLARWTSSLRAEASVHELELRLRIAWVQLVEEVAGWQPRRWQAAVRWLRCLPFLAAVEALARGSPAQGWMRSDPVIGPLVRREPRPRSAARDEVDAGTDCALLLGDALTGRAVASALLARWRASWPRHRAASQALRSILRALRAHRTSLASLPADASSEATERELEQRLLAIFRRHPLSPAAAVAYLGLAALDLARLRGMLAERALRARLREAA